MHDGQPIPPALHIFAIRLAYKLVGIIEPCLRPEMLHDAATAFYDAIVRDMREYEEKKK